MGNKLVVVDVANIRPEGMVRRARFGRRVERRQDALTSMDYIDSLLLAINEQIPSASVVAIADRVLQHRFESPDDQTAFRERTRLPATDPEFIYLMPSQGVRPAPRRPWGRHDEGELGGFVEADELILTVAAASGGLVVSGDYYRDFKYQTLADWLAPSHYVPVRDELNRAWLLCAKSRALRLSSRDRRDPRRIRSIAGVESVHRESAAFDRESDTLLRRHVFETIIPQFWSDRDGESRTFTIGDRAPLLSRPFSSLRLPTRTPVSRVATVLEPVPEMIGKPGLEPSIRVSEPERELAVATSTPSPVRRRLAATLWASSASSNLRYLDQVVRMIGQVFQSSDGTHVLRWVYPSGSIRVRGDVPATIRKGIDVAIIQGLLCLDGDELVLDIGIFATPQVEVFDLYTFYEGQIAKIRARHMQPKIRRWTPPAPRRRPVKPSAVAVRSRALENENENDLRVSGIQPPAVPIIERREAVSPVRREVEAQVASRRVVTTARGVLIAILVVAAAALLLFFVGDSPMSEDGLMRNLQTATGQKRGDLVMTPVVSAASSSFYQDGKLVVKK